MWDDPNSAAARHLEREASRRRLRASQRLDLLDAARKLIPDDGIFVPLGNIATHAGLTRRAARALFNTTSEVATAVVQQSWYRLGEDVAAAQPTTAIDLVAKLIAAIRADAPAHQIYHALRCGAPNRQRDALVEADILLARALGDLVAGLHPGLEMDAANDLAHQLVMLARGAALAPEAPAARTAPAARARAAAARIAGMLAGGIAQAAATAAPAPAPDAAAAAAAAADITAMPQPGAAAAPEPTPPSDAPPDTHPVVHVLAPLAWPDQAAAPPAIPCPAAPALPRLHDPPANAA